MGTPEKIVEENWDLVRGVTFQTVRRYHFPSFLWEEIESAAALALWRAAQKWDGRGGNVRAFLTQQMYWDVLDAVRILSGREGSAKAERQRNSVSLDRKNNVNGEETTLYSLVEDEHVPDASDFMLGDATLQEILAACPDDRHREIVVRTLVGQTNAEIGLHLGVSESRISQMLGKIRQRWEVRTLSKSKAKPGSLIVNWR